MANQGDAILRVVGPGQLSAALEEQAKSKAARAIEEEDPNQYTGLVAFIRNEYEAMRRHRNDAASGWSERLLAAMRVFNGQYDASKLAEIRKFGGSDVYARIVAMKCRGASALLRDVYLSTDRPWGLEPPDDPDVPQEVLNAIEMLVQAEASSAEQLGVQVGPDQLRERVSGLVMSARVAAKKKVAREATLAEDRIDEILKAGGFYKALAEFLVDLPLFPFACIKGPVVRIVPTVEWDSGQARTVNKPRLFWNRVSPFDIYWTGGVSDIEDASTIERLRLTRADLNDLLDLPGYRHDEIRAVLDEYGRGGLVDGWDSVDTERAVSENRENPQMNYSKLISCFEYTGNVQGKMLLEYGMTEEEIPDELRDYHVQAWLIGRHVIKVQLSQSPRRRHPYFITSFEKVPGTPVGNGLPDILADVQDVANAALRSLVNNLSIASGPQVVVHDDRLSHDENGDDLFPWKRWHVVSDPMGQQTSIKPVDFFQPGSNAAELLGVYQKFSEMADELSAIPKYLSGQGAGGAGRTASGLAMLMGNASKILQTVAANIDRDVLDPLLTALYDMVMLTDTTGMLTGKEHVRVLGVNVAVKRETQRARQMEFLQITANPVDLQIIGPKGRASVLRAVASTIGLDGDAIVPPDEIMDMQQQASEAAAQRANTPGYGGMGDNAADAQGSQQSSAMSGDMGPRLKIAAGP